MQSTDLPSKIQEAFAKNAGGSYIRTIPVPSQIGITDGAASWNDGFPPLNFLPNGAGGVNPFGKDFNGVLNAISALSVWYGAGAPINYDSAFQTLISGYPKGAILQSATTLGVLWMSTTENNVTNPDTGGAGWAQMNPSFSTTSFANSSALVAQRINLTIPITNSRQIGQVDNCALWSNATTITAGTLTQLATGALAGGTGCAVRAAGVSTSGGILSFAVRMEARDAKKYKNSTCSFQIAVDHDDSVSRGYTIIAKKVTTTDDVFSALTTIATSSLNYVVSGTATLLTFNAIAMGDCSHGIEFEVQVNTTALTAKNFNYTEWSLDIGLVAPLFIANPYELDLAMCQRYLPAFNSTGSALIGPAYVSSTTQVVAEMIFPVQTRIATTGILSSVASLFSFVSTGVLAGTAISFGMVSTQAGDITLTVAGATAGQGGRWYANYAAYLLFTGAELF